MEQHPASAVDTNLADEVLMNRIHFKSIVL